MGSISIYVRCWKKHHINLQPARKKKLYLKGTDLGRGLNRMGHRGENMLLNIYNSLGGVILKLEEDDKTHLSQIVGYLSNRCILEGIVGLKMLVESEREMF